MADLAGVTVITEDELDSSTLAIAIEEILSMLSSSSLSVTNFRFGKLEMIPEIFMKHALCLDKET